MRTFAQLTCLTLGAAALAGIAGLATAAVVDPGSGIVVAVIVALGILVIGLLEWSDRRRSDVDHAFDGADVRVSADRERLRDRDTSFGSPAWPAAVAGSGAALLLGGPMAPHRS